MNRYDARFKLQVAKEDRKSTRLNSSHSQISYAVFCLKKKNVQIAHGRERPRETDGARFGAGDLPARVRHIEIIEVAERGGRRQLGEALHLMPQPALQG